MASNPPLLQAAFFIALLGIAAVTDIRARIIPDSVCALVALTGLIDFSPVRLFGILAALPLLIAALCKQDSIGGGDIKLTAAAGLVLGFWGGIAGLSIGLAAMLLFFAAGKGRRRIEAALPMAPFLSLGFIAVHIANFTGL